MPCASSTRSTPNPSEPASYPAIISFHGLLHFSGNSRPNPLAQIQEPLPITGLQRVATDLVRQGCVDCNNPTFLAQFDCKKAPYGVIMGCGGRQVVYCPGFHQSLQCTGGEVDTDQIATFRPPRPA